jgi:hypothetical protein
MNSDSDPVGVIAALPDRRASDVLEPMFEPAGDGPPPGSGTLPFSRFFSSSRTLFGFGPWLLLEPLGGVG